MRTIRVLWLAATAPELACAPLSGSFVEPSPWPVLDAGSDAGLVTGCGPAMSAAALSWFLATHRVERIVGLGIAGAYPGSHCRIGRAYRVATERFVDLGAESGSGTSILPLPFPGLDISARPLDAPADLSHLDTAHGATVSLATGTVDAAMDRRATGADLESMEGASWALVAHANAASFAQVRAISNPAGPRDPRSWDIPAALEALRNALAPLARSSR